MRFGEKNLVDLWASHFERSPVLEVDAAVWLAAFKTTYLYESRLSSSRQDMQVALTSKRPQYGKIGELIQ